MDNSRFAVCIIFPGTNATDIVNATIKHDVLILNKETFNPGKDYKTYLSLQSEEGVKIFPLFLFSSKSVLATSPSALREALDEIKELKQN